MSRTNQRKARGAARRARRGLTLVEVIIGTVIALILTAAAVAFATQETRLMDISQERLQVSMVGRSAIALLADDLRKAGAGIGYDETDSFAGLVTNTFTAGSVTFNPLGSPIPDGATPPLPPGSYTDNTFTRPRSGPHQGTSYTAPTHDLGIRVAEGSYATIVRERNNAGVICAGPGIEFLPNEPVIMRDAIGISARSGTIQVTPASTGPGCPCMGGCSNFTLTPTTDFSTGPGADTATFGFGEIQGGYSTIVWFVAINDAGEGELRRAELPGNACAARATCGGLVADFAETLLTQVWRWDSTLNRWLQAGQDPIQASGDRIRVDVELVLRSENETNAPKPEVELRLRAGACVPGPCGGVNNDNYSRIAYRTSVEIMNSGRMRLR